MLINSASDPFQASGAIARIRFQLYRWKGTSWLAHWRQDFYWLNFTRLHTHVSAFFTMRLNTQLFALLVAMTVGFALLSFIQGRIGLPSSSSPPLVFGHAAFIRLHTPLHTTSVRIRTATLVFVLVLALAALVTLGDASRVRSKVLPTHASDGPNRASRLLSSYVTLFGSFRPLPVHLGANYRFSCLISMCARDWVLSGVRQFSPSFNGSLPLPSTPLPQLRFSLPTLQVRTVIFSDCQSEARARLSGATVDRAATAPNHAPLPFALPLLPPLTYQTSSRTVF